MYYLTTFVIILFVIGCYSANCIAIVRDPEQTIKNLIPEEAGMTNIYSSDDEVYISSDILTVDRKSNRAIFEGEVVLWFDKMVLKTSNLQILYKESQHNKRTIDRIIIPSKVIAKKEEDQEVVIADSAEYIVDKAELTLKGNIKLERQDQVLKADRLVYHGLLKKITKE